jgi:hypothetical protein
MWGCGVDVTTITTTYLSASNQIFKPGSNAEYHDFTFQTTNSTPGVTYDLAFGATGTNSFTNTVVKNVRVKSHTDGIYISSSVPCSIKFENVAFETEWDTCVISGAAHVVTVDDVLLAAIENNSFHLINGTTVESPAILKGDNLRVRQQAGGSTSTVIGLSDGGALYLTNSSVLFSGTASSVTSVSLSSPSTLVRGRPH